MRFKTTRGRMQVEQCTHANCYAATVVKPRIFACAQPYPCSARICHTSVMQAEVKANQPSSLPLQEYVSDTCSLQSAESIAASFLQSGMSSNAVVHLNVGGRLFTTTHATLTSPSAQGSMLEAMANMHLQQQQQQCQKLMQGHSSQDSTADADTSATAALCGTGMQPTLSDPRHPDALFIDRDGSCFKYILGYLRDGPEAVLPPDLHTTQQLLREAQYYQLTGLEQLLQAQVQTLTEAAETPDKQLKELQTINKNTSYTPEDIGKMLETLKCMSGTLDKMRAYLVPKVAYHTGKRGGPNYSRPRQFLNDLGDIMPSEDTRRR